MRKSLWLGTAMAANLAGYFVYCFAVSFFTGYVARHTLNFGAAKMVVFQVTGTMAMASYALRESPLSSMV